MVVTVFGLAMPGCLLIRQLVKSNSWLIEAFSSFKPYINVGFPSFKPSMPLRNQGGAGRSVIGASSFQYHRRAYWNHESNMYFGETYLCYLRLANKSTQSTTSV